MTNQQINKVIKDLIFEIIMLLFCLSVISYAWNRYDKIKQDPSYNYCIKNNVNVCIDNE